VSRLSLSQSVFSSFMTYHCVCNHSNTTCATSGAGTGNYSGAHELFPALVRFVLLTTNGTHVSFFDLRLLIIPSASSIFSRHQPIHLFGSYYIPLSKNSMLNYTSFISFIHFIPLMFYFCYLFHYVVIRSDVLQLYE
jgi:hypothetical protein